jgi:hypothetical protein
MQKYDQECRASWSHCPPQVSLHPCPAASALVDSFCIPTLNPLRTSRLESQQPCSSGCSATSSSGSKQGAWYVASERMSTYAISRIAPSALAVQGRAAASTCHGAAPSDEWVTD